MIALQSRRIDLARFWGLVLALPLVASCQFDDYLPRPGGHGPGQGHGHGPGHAPGGSAGAPARPEFTQRVLARNLAAPYEITWGPDQLLWVTERVGKRVLRLSPQDGSQVSAFEIQDVLQTAGQDGLLGLALHPALLERRGRDYVYLAYTYDADLGEAELRRTKLRRYTFDRGSHELVDPIDLITDLPASNDHNSGRLVFGPDQHLYYTIGDQGNNQFNNKCNPIRAQETPTQEEVSAQDWSKYVGKVLRLNLDGSIPADNPLIRGTRSHVYSYGHRNAQGLVFSSAGRLYADEHGPKTDDELNWIQPGANYGWPNVAGYRDDQAYVYGNWSASPSCPELEFSDYVIPESVPVQRESEFLEDFTPPLRTFYTVEDDHDFIDPACAGNEYICWPTVAPSSLDYYPNRGKIAAWRNSLLLSTLKHGSIFRVQLSPDGRVAVGETEVLFKTTNRYRDLTFSPDGSTFYIITDPRGPGTVGPDGVFTNELENPASLLEFKLVER